MATPKSKPAAPKTKTAEVKPASATPVAPVSDATDPPADPPPPVETETETETAPATPKSAAKAKPEPKADVVRVSTTAERGRWRIGRQFGREETVIPLAELTPEQLDALKGDPVLVVIVEAATE